MATLSGNLREAGVTAVNTGYAVTMANHNSVLDVTATGGAVAVSLPGASTVGNGFHVTIQRNTASDSNVTVGAPISATLTASDSVCELYSDGSSWLRVARGGGAPAAHAASHNAGGSDALAIDAAAATGSLRTLGTSSTSACAGNDPRLSDARTPTAHSHSHTALSDIGTNTHATIDSHLGSTSNPHSVTATQVGLGTGDSPQLTAINIGHASDTTLSRKAAGILQVESSEVRFALPGEVIAYAGSAAPAGWMLCDGAEYSQSTYAALYAVLGSTYNTGGETSGYFRVPDLKGRVIAGKESSATRLTSGGCGIDGATLGAAGGNENLHQHSHLIAAGAAAFASGGAGTVSKVEAGGGTYNTANAGTGSSQNVQPTLVLNYLIKY